MRSSGRQSKAGFSLVETMVAVAISGMVLTATLYAFLWCGQTAYTGMRVNWSRQEAMMTAARISAYVRNASAISDIDTENGLWVDLAFPDGTKRRLLYSNGSEYQRDGRLYLQEEVDGAFPAEPAESDLIVVRGMTAVLSEGYSEHVFACENTSYLRVAYRISEPTSSGLRATNDSDFAVRVRFGVYLRNSG